MNIKFKFNFLGWIIITTTVEEQWLHGKFVIIRCVPQAYPISLWIHHCRYCCHYCWNIRHSWHFDMTRCGRPLALSLAHSIFFFLLNLTFIFIFNVVWQIFNWHFNSEPPLRVLCGGLCILLLFLSNQMCERNRESGGDGGKKLS